MISLSRDLAHAFPRDPAARRLRGQTLDEAAGAADQRGDPAALAMNFMDPAERLPSSVLTLCCAVG